MPYVKFQVLTQVHEMGHHVWALGDEYSRSRDPGRHRYAVVRPTTRRSRWSGARSRTMRLSVPRRDPGLRHQSRTPIHHRQLVDRGDRNARLLTVADRRRRRDRAVPVPGRVRRGGQRTSASWSTRAARRRARRGRHLDACSRPRHRVLHRQQPRSRRRHRAGGARNHDSCWEFHLERSGFTTLTAPDPASPGPATGSTTPDWIVLDKQLALLGRRSTDRARWPSGNKMADAQHGAVYWLEYCAVGTDLLSIVAYDDQIDTTLAQTRSLRARRTRVRRPPRSTHCTPRGATDIRDALFRARDEIESLPTRAAVQVALLLTDGVHNSPSGRLAAGGDSGPSGGRHPCLCARCRQRRPRSTWPPLDALATGTGGRSYADRRRPDSSADREHHGGDQRRGPRRDHHDRADLLPRQHARARSTR